ncbi:17316_t:CDS:2 [Entrophospora sp. SA101]|nr:17316_t:CDS:2 [Entrophospora sp. SA101]
MRIGELKSLYATTNNLRRGNTAIMIILSQALMAVDFQELFDLSIYGHCYGGLGALRKIKVTPIDCFILITANDVCTSLWLGDCVYLSQPPPAPKLKIGYISRNLH